MKRARLIAKAKEFRRKGYSVREISEKLEISKSTASLWLRDVDIPHSGRDRLAKLKEDAIRKTQEYKHAQKKKYLFEIQQGCSVLKGSKKYSKEDYKIFLALLFWCEGSKGDRRLVFMNSDVMLVKTYLNLLRSAYSIDENRLRATLHLHEYHDKEIEVTYWSNVTGIGKENLGVYNKSNSGARKKDGYRGCISIRYGDVRILDELFVIIERFTKYISAGVG